MSGGFFVPHDLNAPVQGATSGPLAGLTAVVKSLDPIALCADFSHRRLRGRKANWRLRPRKGTSIASSIWPFSAAHLSISLAATGTTA
jgi:hypothetical protein